MEDCITALVLLLVFIALVIAGWIARRIHMSRSVRRGEYGEYRSINRYTVEDGKHFRVHQLGDDVENADHPVRITL